jgi:hypothetical protein
MKYLTEREISVKTLEEVMAIQKVLLDNDYVVMVSKEEQYYIINYVWSYLSDRNDIVFRNRSDFLYEMSEENKKYT